MGDRGWGMVSEGQRQRRLVLHFTVRAMHEHAAR